jgi:hypothetical protein
MLHRPFTLVPLAARVRLTALHLLAAIVCLPLLAPPAVAEFPIPAAEWDQARVTSLAEELAKKVDGLYDSIYKSETGRRLGDSYAVHQLKDRIRLMQHEARHLRGNLKDGKSRKETFPIVERLGELARDANEFGQQAYLSNQLLTSIADAQDVWRRLQPYYEPDKSQAKNQAKDQAKDQAKEGQGQ